MANNVKILFWIKANRINKKGVAPLMLKVKSVKSDCQQIFYTWLLNLITKIGNNPSFTFKLDSMTFKDAVHEYAGEPLTRQIMMTYKRITIVPMIK